MSEEWGAIKCSVVLARNDLNEVFLYAGCAVGILYLLKRPSG